MKNIQKLVFISNDNTALKEKEIFNKLINETYPLVIYELLNADSYKELKDKSLIDFDFDSLEKRIRMLSYRHLFLILYK